MAPALISQPVLAAKPVAKIDAHINGLLDELRQCIDELPIVPGQTVKIDSAKLQELRGVFMDMSSTVRNRLKWAK